MTHTANFALPKGWTYATWKAFLESELNEDDILPAEESATDNPYDSYRRYSISDFDDKVAIFQLNWDGPLYQVDYSVANPGSGPDATWGTPYEVAQKVTYVKVAEMQQERIVTPPHASVAQFSSDLSQFASAPFDDTMDWVTRTGIVFEAGDFPDIAKQLGLESLVFGSSDLATMVETFVPVNNRVSHVNGKTKVPTIFDDHMGVLERIWTDETGTRLHGEIRIPRFLDEFAKNERGGGPLQASLEIDPVTMRVVGNTIVPNPRVETTALMSACAAFSRAIAPEKETVVADKDDEKVTTPPQTQTIDPVEFARVMRENEENRAQLARMAKDTRERDAEAFAIKQLRGGKVPAVAKPLLVALFTAVSEDDASAAKTINFAVGDKAIAGNRVQTLEATFDALPALMTREMIPGESQLAAFADATPDAKSVEDARAQAEAYRDSLIAQRTNGR